MQLQVERLSPLQHAPADVAFDELVAPLEQRFARRLSGPNRAKCHRAFYENPDGFTAVRDEVLARGRSLGLLVRMVDDGDHRAAPRVSNGKGNGTPASPFDDCMACGERRALRDVDGRFVCIECADRKAAA